jgi:hypothetical protein
MRKIWAEHVACMGAMRNAYEVLVGKPEGKRLHNIYIMFKASRHFMLCRAENDC